MASYDLKIDDVDGSVFYAGQALPNTATSAASWQIQRITIGVDSIDAVFADGDTEFDNVWDNRASLSY